MHLLTEAHEKDASKTIDEFMLNFRSAIEHKLMLNVQRMEEIKSEYRNTKLNELGIDYSATEMAILADASEHFMIPQDELTIGHISQYRENNSYAKMLYSRLVLGNYKHLVPQEIRHNITTIGQIDFIAISVMLAKLSAKEKNPNIQAQIDSHNRKLTWLLSL